MWLNRTSKYQTKQLFSWIVQCQVSFGCLQSSSILFCDLRSALFSIIQSDAMRLRWEWEAITSYRVDQDTSRSQQCLFFWLLMLQIYKNIKIYSSLYFLLFYAINYFTIASQLELKLAVDFDSVDSRFIVWLLPSPQTFDSYEVRREFNFFFRRPLHSSPSSSFAIDFDFLIKTSTPASHRQSKWIKKK